MSIGASFFILRGYMSMADFIGEARGKRYSSCWDYKLKIRDASLVLLLYQVLTLQMVSFFKVQNTKEPLFKTMALDKKRQKPILHVPTDCDKIFESQTPTTSSSCVHMCVMLLTLGLPDENRFNLNCFSFPNLPFSLEEQRNE